MSTSIEPEHFHKSGGTGSGTFESPKGTTLKQAEIDALPEGAAIYLATGEYSLQEETQAAATKNWFSWGAALHQIRPHL